MDESRLGRIEARLSSIEEKVYGPLAPPKSAGNDEPPLHPITTPAAASLYSVESSQRPTDFEALVAGRGLQIAGFVTLLVGVALFLDLAFTRDWVGPAERIMLGLISGSVLIGFAAARIKAPYRQLADNLIGLGGGILYLSLWAAVNLFPELHVERGIAFPAMIAVTSALAALAAARRSQTVALFGTIGGLITPVLLTGGPTDHVVLAMYLLSMCAGMLWVATRCNFAAVEVLAVLGAMLYAPTFAPDVLQGGQWSRTAAEIVAALFAATFGIAFTVGNSKTNEARARRLTLLVVDAAAYGVVLEAMFARNQTLLGDNMLGFAAMLLAIAYIRALPAAFKRTYGYLGLGAVTLALPALLHQSTLVDALVIESVLLIAVGSRGDWRIARAGAVLLLGAGLDAIVQMWISAPDQALRVDVSFGLALAGGAYLLRNLDALVLGDRGGFWHSLARIAVDVLAVNGISRLCLDLCGGPYWDQVVPSQAQVALSVCWTLYAAGLFSYGLRRGLASLRWEAIMLFAANIIKVFAVDMSSVDLEYRVASFVVLGVVLYVVSAWYTRATAHARPGAMDS